MLPKSRSLRMMLTLVLLVVIVIGIGFAVQMISQQNLPSEHVDAATVPYDRKPFTLSGDDNEQLVFQFIRDKLSHSDGVYTNYLDTDQSDQNATGHEILSESTGLLMRYYVRTGQKSEFDQVWAFARQTFDLQSGFSYRYSPKLDKRYMLNAAVDDLRIIRALHEAAVKFQEAGYHEQANAYGERFLTYNVKDGYMYDFYDEQYRTTNAFITLCYIDIATLRQITAFSDAHNALLIRMNSIVANGYISDQFPFYETRFDYASKSYQSDQIRTVESLITILSLAEMKQQKPASVSFIKEHVKQGTLYGQYTKEGKAANQVQSTAIYALAAMIGAELGDQELYEASIARMNQFQIQDSASPFYGGFGDVKTEMAYSFDNLMALLAYTYKDEL